MINHIGENSILAAFLEEKLLKSDYKKFLAHKFPIGNRKILWEEIEKKAQK